MAKGKHSAALFEVIKGNSAGRSDQVSQSLRTPLWWFKSRPSASEAPEAAIRGREVESLDPSMTAIAPPRPTLRPATPGVGSNRSSAVHLDFDRGRKEITLRLRYTTALVSAFGVCALIGSAYVVGRHLNHGPQTASAAMTSSTVPLYTRQPPQAGVADVARQRLLHPLTTGTPQPKTAAQPKSVAEAANPSHRDIAPPSLVPASAETRLPRTIGLNYVIIQTYPSEESKNAQATSDYLTRNGIPCTLEHTEYAHNWLCLVGTAGFTKISSADFKSYVDNIIRIGEKFPSSHFDHIRPAAYKWKAPVEQ